jgi:hypothetical protein
VIVRLLILALTVTEPLLKSSTLHPQANFFPGCKHKKKQQQRRKARSWPRPPQLQPTTKRLWYCSAPSAHARPRLAQGAARACCAEWPGITTCCCCRVVSTSCACLSSHCGTQLFLASVKVAALLYGIPRSSTMKTKISLGLRDI